MIDYDMLPKHMRGAARRYVEEGILPGDFLAAVLCNDLMESYVNADNINVSSMRSWVMWLYNDAPSACHGSMDIVRGWCELGGLHGKGPQDAGGGA